MSAVNQVEAGCKYLKVGDTYYSPDRLASMHRVFSILDDSQFSPTVCVCLGAGGRQEPFALQSMFPSIGLVVPVDLSYTVAQSASHPENNIFPVQADVGTLPFAQNSLDLIVAKSVFHEVFSYSPHGLRAVLETIQQSFVALAPGGKLYYLDFAAPDQDVVPHDSIINITLQTELAQILYTLMKDHYRKFENGYWSDYDKSQLDNVRDSNDNMFPTPQNGNVSLPLAPALEFFLHLPPFINDHNSSIFPEKPNHWKEIQESYFIKQGQSLFTPMDQLHMFNRNDIDVTWKLWNNPGTVEVLCEHLSVKIPGVDISDSTIFEQSTRKMIVAATKKG